MPSVIDGVNARIFGEPIALDDYFAVEQNTTLDVTAATGLLVNDGDPDGGTVSINLITNSTDNGSLVVFPNGRMSYTPDNGFAGTDSFQFRVVDSDGNSTISTATITVYENSAPVAADENYTVMEGTVLSVGPRGLLFNDVDTGGENLAVNVILDGTDDGSLLVFPNGNFTYTPDSGFVGTDSFTYRIRDTASQIDTATATITVVENPAPFAADDYYAVRSDTVLSIAADGILANDIDPDGSDLVVSVILDGTDNGTLLVFPGGNFTYTPDAGFVGLDSFTYRMRDANGNFDTATVTVDVVEGAPPVGVDDHFITRQGESFTITAPGILANDVDPEGGGLNVSVITNGVDDGSLVVFPGGNFTYTPDPGFVGTDSFTYRIRNEAGEFAQATASITVVENLAPTALDDAYSVQFGSTLTVDAATGVLTNDFDPEGGTNAVSVILDGVDHGSLSVFPNGRFTYTPDLDFLGTDSFTYRMRDVFGNTDTATVSIDVHFGFFPAAPTVVDDTYSVGENQTLEVAPALGVLANDYDINGNSINVSVITNGVDNGSLSVFPNGRFVYTPDTRFFGTDSFDYRITDSTGESSTGTATIVVVENAAPVTAPETYSVLRGQTLTVAAAEGVLANDLDPEGTGLSVSVITNGVDNGSLSVFQNGRFTYTPDSSFTGTDSFTYRTTDADGQSATQTVSLIVRAPVDPIATQDAYSVLGNRALTVNAADGILANDLSLDGSNLSVSVILNSVDNGSLSVFGDGRFNYTPDTGFVGTDSFTYRIRTENGAFATATVDLNVVEDPVPVAGDDTYSVVGGTTLDVTAEFGLLLNDVDPSGDALTVSVITDGADNGSLSVFGDGRFSYTPDDGFSGTDSFTYRVRDEFGFIASAEATIEVVAPAAPIALDNAYFTYAGVPLSIAADTGVLANDVSPDGLDLNVTLITDGVDNGTLSLFANGRFTYTPDEGFAGVDSFTYRITDAFGATAQAEVAIGVRGNVAPLAVDDGAITQEETSILIAVLENDSDLNGDALSISDLSDPDNGSAFVFFGQVFYTPDLDFVGQDSFTYTLSDGALADTATITVTVEGTNDAPVMNAGGPFSLAENTTNVGTITASDVDGDALTFAVTGGADGAFFDINATTGALSFITAPDFEAPGDQGGDNGYEVQVEVSDGQASDDFIFAVNVMDAEEGGGGLVDLIGTSGRDRLAGTAADERFDGLDGSDMYIGGAGADIFVFVANGVRERETIRDFETGFDAIELDTGYSVNFTSRYAVIRTDDQDQILIYGDATSEADLNITNVFEIV